MRRLLLFLLVAFATSPLLRGQACTGLCLQQVACTGGGTTSISGTVYAPNGTDPLPHVLVFIPNAAVPAMTPGVSCPTPGAVPGGSPLVGTLTASDGTFKLTNVPVGTNIPLVIQSGRWRRQLVIPSTAACADTAFSTRMPRNQGEGDIPLFAVATGSADTVECVLRKVGIDDAEFTNPMSTGRIHVYAGTNSRGAVIDTSTPVETTLMDNISTLNQYDVLMLPCQGGQYTKSPAELSNLVQYANAGGRVYASHFSYVWMYQNPPFNTVANWHVNQAALADGYATVNPNFYGYQTLTDWLQTVGASTTPGQVVVTTNKHDLDGVNAPTQSWITLNDPANGNPVMQLTFNTPVGTTNQCGRVLFNEYHVANRTNSPTPANRPFPTECSGGALTAQEKLLEYSLFDLTNDGGQPTLTPASADFGTEYLGFTTAPKTFTWTNNSIFPVSITSAAATGDFAVTSSNCSNVAPSASCSITVVYRPTTVGPTTGTLTVQSNSGSLTASLTGIGAQSLSVSSTALTFPNTDVGATAVQNLVLTNSAPGAVPLSGLGVTGDFFLAGNCGSTLAAGASCTIQVTFKPSTTGARIGQATVSGISIALSGNGVDFSTAFTPASGKVIAGVGANAPMSILPIAGFSAQVTLTCSTTAPASTCVLSQTSLVPSANANLSAQINTTSKYTVIGYGGAGTWKLALVAMGSGCLLLAGRKRLQRIPRTALLVLLLAVGGMMMGGCGGKSPELNPAYTAPGAYTYTVTATDGFLVHSATYSLTVTAK